MRRILTASVILLALMVILGGCAGSGGSESAQINRARMVGNENLKLKKQLSAKDGVIKDLEKKIAALKVEKAKISKDCGDTNLKIMQMMAKNEKRNEELTAENHALKEELEKFK